MYLMDCVEDCDSENRQNEKKRRLLPFQNGLKMWDHWFKYQLVKLKGSNVAEALSTIHDTYMLLLLQMRLLNNIILICNSQWVKSCKLVFFCMIGFHFI